MNKKPPVKEQKTTFIPVGDELLSKSSWQFCMKVAWGRLLCLDVSWSLLPVCACDS